MMSLRKDDGVRYEVSPPFLLGSPGIPTSEIRAVGYQPAD